MSTSLRFALLLPIVALLLAASPSSAQPPRWASVSVGDDHVCALDSRGVVSCFGNNHSAQLGWETAQRCGIMGESGRRGCWFTASDSVPNEVAASVPFVSVDAGRYVTCARDAAGGAWCWGRALGRNPGYLRDCRSDPCSFAPVAVDSARRFANVDAESRCAIDTAGTATCWGSDPYAERREPDRWPGLAVTSVASDANEKTYCAVDREGRAWCRGEAIFGVRGDGTRRGDADRPVDQAEPFAELAVVGRWVCGRTGEGRVSCWGAAGYDDATRVTGDRPGFERCDRWSVVTWCNLRPVSMETDLRFVRIDAGVRSRRILGLTASGEAYTWSGDRRPEPWHPERRWASASLGDWGECGVTTDGELHCWGLDPYDEIRGAIRPPGAR